MSTLDLDPLRAWGRAWEIPELWSALCRKEQRLTTEEIARMVVRRLANPAEPKEIFREFLQLGSRRATCEVEGILLERLHRGQGGELEQRLAGALCTGIVLGDEQLFEEVGVARFTRGGALRKG